MSDCCLYPWSLGGCASSRGMIEAAWQGCVSMPQQQPSPPSCATRGSLVSHHLPELSWAPSGEQCERMIREHKAPLGVGFSYSNLLLTHLGSLVMRCTCSQSFLTRWHGIHIFLLLAEIKQFLCLSHLALKGIISLWNTVYLTCDFNSLLSSIKSYDFVNYLAFFCHC